MKECLAFLSRKLAARSVWGQRGAPAWSSIWTASRRDSPASSSIPRKKASGCAEASTLGAAKWSSLSSTKRRPAPSAAAWCGSAKPAPSRREKSAWKPFRRSFGQWSHLSDLTGSSCISAHGSQHLRARRSNLQRAEADQLRLRVRAGHPSPGAAAVSGFRNCGVRATLTGKVVPPRSA